MINADEIAAVIRAQLADPEITALSPVGAVDQFSDSAEILEWPALAHRLASAGAVSVAERGG